MWALGTTCTIEARIALPRSAAACDATESPSNAAA